jgi:DNA-binding transcriptional regulator YhcF (GntR family)
MFDIQPDSPVPVHEQIATQVTAHVASGALKPGAKLTEGNLLAQQLLTNPRAVARAYADLEWDGVLRKSPSGGMEVTSDAAVICRLQQQHAARQRLHQAVRDALASGLGEADIRKAVDQGLAPPAPVPSAAEAPDAPEKPSHVSGHRASQGVQKLPRQAGRGSPQPDHPPGGDIRPARR